MQWFLVMVNEMFGISANFCWLFGFRDKVLLWSMELECSKMSFAHYALDMWRSF